MIVRQFKLINDVEEVYDLMDTIHFMQNPTGLGQEMSTDYSVNNGYVTVLSDGENAMQIGGEIIFAKYIYYKEFIYFLNKSNVVWLEYSYEDEEPVRAKIKKTVDIEKSEISGGALFCPITFLRLEHWKSSKKQVVALEMQSTDGKKYPYKYPFKYSIGNVSKVEITNNSNSPIPLKIYFNPLSSNPLVNVISVSSGKEVSKWQWLGEVTDGQLVVNGIGDYTEQYIKYNGANAYGNLNFSPGFSSFIYVPPGEHFVEFQSDAVDMGDIIVEFYGEANTL